MTSVISGENKNVPSFRELFPEIPENQLEEAQKNFDHYIALVVRIAERLMQEERDSEQKRDEY